jgi:gamma-glutamylcyclotransferase (GGCT)/AIG2-like uncharacterized protein YtfP
MARERYAAASMGMYAAYGSNMDPEQMLERCPHSPFAGTGWLKGWRLTFGGEDIGWEGALATIVEDEQSTVFVALYDISPYDTEQLDRWEGADTGLYNRIHVRVSTLDGDELAWTYVLNAYEGGLPSARYLGLMGEAAEKAGAPDEYVAELRARPCRSLGD